MDKKLLKIWLKGILYGVMAIIVFYNITFDIVISQLYGAEVTILYVLFRSEIKEFIEEFKKYILEEMED